MTTAKWYRQKGTGRARHGAQSAPIFVGGGRAHGPKPRDYSKQMPKKMRRGAIRSALSTLVRDNQLVVVDKLDIDTPKTKEVRQVLTALVNDQSALILVTAEQKSMRKSVNNLADAHSIIVDYLNIRDLLKYDKVIMPLDTLEVIKNIWGKEG